MTYFTRDTFQTGFGFVSCIAVVVVIVVIIVKVRFYIFIIISKWLHTGDVMVVVVLA